MPVDDPSKGRSFGRPPEQMPGQMSRQTSLQMPGQMSRQTSLQMSGQAPGRSPGRSPVQSKTPGGAPHVPPSGAPRAAAVDGFDKAPALTWLRLPPPAMESFDPARHMPEQRRSHGDPSASSAPLPLFTAARAHPDIFLIPGPEDCRALWERYAMLEHIKAHSLKVARFAEALALSAREQGAAVDPQAVLAAGLLHDLGKTYTIANGGNHAMLGAAWVMRECGNPQIARGVLFHVYWPFEEIFDDDLFLVMAIIYADKRTMHDGYVSLDERFEDLLTRYGVNDYIRERIALSHAQGKRIEAALSRRLGVNLDECTADSGRLVQRT